MARQFEGRREHVEGLLTYMASVKELLADEDAAPRAAPPEQLTIDRATLAGLVKQIGKQLPQEKFANLACEQVCSRHIEYLLRYVRNALIALVAGTEEDDDGPFTAQEVIEQILEFWKLIASYLLNGEYVQLATNQYGSHTVECVIDCLASVLETVAHKGEVVTHFDEVLRNVAADVFNKDAFWTYIADAKATFCIRKLATLCQHQLLPNTQASFKAFCARLFRKEKNWDRLRTEVYVSATAAVTLQTVLKAYAAVAEDANVAAHIVKTVESDKGPVIDSAWMHEMAIKSPVGNRMLDWIVSEKLVIERSIIKSMYAIILSRLSEYLSTHGRFVFKALLLHYPPSPKQLDLFLDELDMDVLFTKQNYAMLRTCVQACQKANKLSAQKLVKKLSQFLLHEPTENFWRALLTKQIGKDKVKGYSFVGLTIACDMVVCLKPGALGPKLMDDLSEFLNDSSFDKLALEKKGVTFLQNVHAHLPDKYKALVRKRVKADLEKHAFSPYTSFLVRDVMAGASASERKNTFASIKTSLKQRNFALYQALNLDSIFSVSAASY